MIPSYQPVKDSGVNYLVDTGPLVAMLNALDGYHVWSAGALRALGDVFHTTEAVLTETCHLLQPSRHALKVLMDAVELGKIRVHQIFPDETARINALLQKYQQMDLADASMVVLSEMYPRAKLITLDKKDFTIYRRRDGLPVPCIMPEG